MKSDRVLAQRFHSRCGEKIYKSTKGLVLGMRLELGRSEAPEWADLKLRPE